MKFICTRVQPDGRYKCTYEEAVRGLMLNLRAIDEYAEYLAHCKACGSDFVDEYGADDLCLRCREMVKQNWGGLSYHDVLTNALYVVTNDPNGYHCQFVTTEGIIKDTSEKRISGYSFYYQGQMPDGMQPSYEGIMIWPEAK